MLFKILDASIPALGGVIFLLVWRRIIPVKKNARDNEVFCQKYSKLMLCMSIILLLLSIMIFVF
jgi:hypothetical protein